MRPVETNISMGIRSVSRSGQSLRYPHEKPLFLIYPSRFRRVSTRNLAECLREILRSFSANFRGVSPRHFAHKTLREKSDFYFSPRKIFFRARGVPRRNEKKELFSWADLYVFIRHDSEIVYRVPVVVLIPSSSIRQLI